MVNKHIMDKDGASFPYPLCISLVGVVASALASRTLVCLGVFVVRPESLACVSAHGLLRGAFPIGFCNAMMFATGNAVYLHLGVGFIQMLKAFSPAVILMVMRVAGIRAPSSSEMSCVLLIIAGTLLEVRGELHPSAWGLALMFLSELLEACSLVLTQQLFRAGKVTVVEALYIVAPAGAACLGLLVAILEGPRLVSSGDHSRLVGILPELSIAAVLGVAVNFVSFAILQETCAVTLKVLNIMRGIGVVMIGIVCFGEGCSCMEVFGYGVSICGFCGYNYVQLYPQQGDCLERWSRGW
eukprot:CAMPEP_0117461620 /NCGR_PEP_ID=MMETSP0784-20121206/2622_1 /TAXON_ID=39447 /ORGANISM="" /LENGTH=297 /DNA_ID=CAMNT_0005255339 /DNA_START=153 /DNA_END=1043 /DNA_ORIENTATION=+